MGYEFKKKVPGSWFRVPGYDENLEFQLPMISIMGIDDVPGYGNNLKSPLSMISIMGLDDHTAKMKFGISIAHDFNHGLR
jgi:hypothetical protein